MRSSTACTAERCSINSTGYTSDGQLDQIALKVAPNNGIKWVQVYGGVGQDWLNGAALDSAGNAYIVGFVTMQTISTTIPYNSNHLTAMHTGSQSMIAKLDSTDGHDDWVTSFDSAVAGNGDCLAVAVNPVSGNVAVACVSAAAFVFTDTSNAMHTVANTDGIFVAELDPTSGRVAQSAYFAGLGGVAGGQTAGYNLGRGGQGGLSYDSAGDLYVSGYVSTPTMNVSIPSTSGTTAFTITRKGTNTGANDTFVVKLTASTWSKQWVSVFGSASQDVVATGAAVDTSGNVFVAGTFNGSCDFGNGALTAVGAFDAFIVKVSPTGTELASTSFGGGTVTTQPYGIGVDSAGNPTLGGTYAGTGPSITIGSTTLPNSGGGAWNGWSAKFNASLSTDLWAQGDVTNATSSSQGLEVSGFAVNPSDGTSGMTGSLIGGINFDGGAVDAGGVTSSNGLFLLRRAP